MVTSHLLFADALFYCITAVYLNEKNLMLAATIVFVQASFASSDSMTTAFTSRFSVAFLVVAAVSLLALIRT